MVSTRSQFALVVMKPKTMTRFGVRPVVVIEGRGLRHIGRSA
jgi:hypothetical protein